MLVVASHEKARHMGNDQPHKTDGARCEDHEADEHRHDDSVDRAQKWQVHA